MTPESLKLLQHYKGALTNEIITGESDIVFPATLRKYEAATSAAHSALVAHIEALEDAAVVPVASAGRLNHMLSIAFELRTDHEADDITADELRGALHHRLVTITDAELIETCGAPHDTYETAKEN